MSDPQAKIDLSGLVKYPPADMTFDVHNPDGTITKKTVKKGQSLSDDIPVPIKGPGMYGPRASAPQSVPQQNGVLPAIDLTGLVRPAQNTKQSSTDSQDAEGPGIRDTILNFFRPLSAQERQGIESKLGTVAGPIVEGVGNAAMGVAQGFGSVLLHPLNTIYGTAQTAADALNQMFPDSSLTPQQKAAKDASLTRLKDQWEQIKENPDFTLGTLVGSIEGGRAIPEATGYVKGKLTKGLQATVEKARTGAQSALGAGENAVKREVASQAEAANTAREKAIQNNAAATEKTLTERGKVDEANAAADLLRKQHEQAVEVTDAANNAKMAEHAAKVQSVEDANAAAQAEFEAAKAKVDEITKAAQDTETQRGQLARQVQQQSARMIDRLRQVQAAWKDSSELQKSKYYQPVGILDKAYAKLRQMTSGATVPSSALADAVKNAQSKIAGSNESIKIFKDILSKNPDADPEFIDYQGTKIPRTNPLYDVLKEQGHVEENAPPTWKDLQGYYTELGRSLSSGNLPNDVYLALRSLQSDIGGLMDQMASSRGAGALWKTTKAQYRDFMQTFRESTGPNHSGSPIAQALDAKDPAYAIKPLTAEETAQRVRNDLSRFDPPVNGVGGAAKLYDNFRDVSRQFDSLPKPIKIPEAPAAPTLSPTPIAPSLAPRPTLPKGAEPVSYSEPHPTTPIEVPEINTRELRQKFIDDRLGSWTKLSRWQFGRLVSSPIIAVVAAATGHPIVGLLGLGEFGAELSPFRLQKLMEKPAVREWFTRPPEGELEALQQVPYADRVKIIDGLNQVLITARKSGRPIPISPAVGAFLSGHTKPFETKEQYLKRLRDEHQVSGLVQ